MSLRRPAVLLLALLLAVACDDSPGTGQSDAPFDWCSPDRPPDGPCYAAKRAPESENVSLAREIAHTQLDWHPPETMAWNWEEAVLMLGMVELYRVTGETAFQDYYRAWMDHHLSGAHKIYSSDSCVPVAMAVALLHQTGDQGYQDVVDEALVYLEEKARRTEEGGISHMGTLPLVTLWVDSLFMFGSVLVSQGELSGDAGALDLYGSQFEIFTSILQEDQGFYKHAYQWIFEQDDGVYWARGNGWVAAAAYDYLRVRRNRSESDEGVEEAARRLVEALLPLQDAETGLWWTVLNRPGETYLETSAAALLAFAMARGFRYGHLDGAVLVHVRRAMEGLRSRIVTDGAGRPVVTGTSGPTGVGGFDNYAGTPVGDDIPYGVGAVILALLETSGLP